MLQIALETLKGTFYHLLFSSIFFSFELNPIARGFYDSNFCIVIIIECLVDDISKEASDEDLLNIC